MKEVEMTWGIAVLFHLLFWLLGQGLQKSIVDTLPRVKALSLMFFVCAGILIGYNSIFGSFRFEQDFLLIGLVGFINAYGAYCQWRAYQYSLSRTSLFFALPGVITVGLSALFLGEALIYNFQIILGVSLLFSAAFLLSKHQGRERKENAIQWKWLLFGLGMVLITGGTIFMMKFFSFTVPRSTFLLYWYIGSFLGTLPLLWFEKERGKLFQGEVWWRIPLASFGVVGSLAMVYWAFQLAPAGIVEPIRRFGMAFLPILIGWFIFKERAGLAKSQIIGFVLGIIGASLVILSVY